MRTIGHKHPIIPHKNTKIISGKGNGRGVIQEAESKIKSLDILSAIFSGLLLVLLFPRYNLEVMAWFSLVPLFWAIDGKKPYHGFYLGCVTGFVFFLGLVYWVFIAVSRYGNLNTIVSILVLLLLVSYLSLFVGVFAFLVRYLKGRIGLREVTTAPFIWVSLEYIRSFLFTGFPWESLGYSQFLFLPIIQVSDITGVYGISFLIVLINALLFNIIQNRFLKGEKKLYKETACAILLLTVTLVYGAWRLSDDNDSGRPSKTLKVALIQGNIDQSKKWDRAFQEETIEIYRDLSLKAAQSTPDLIVWPETATPFYFQSYDKYRDTILNIARDTGSNLLFGSPAFKETPGRIEYFNSAFLVSSQGSLVDRYDKVHLVPLGEYVPLKKLLFFVDKITEGIGDFSSGIHIMPMESVLGKFGVFICYEAIFPDLVRRFVQRGAVFLVNITNDAWFGRTSAPYQHLSMVVFRAVENKVPIARAANTGISSIIDKTGKIRSSTEIFSKGMLIGEISVKESSSFYSLHGDIFAKMCLGVTILIIFREVMKSVKRYA